MRGFKGLLPLLLVGAAGIAWLLLASEPGSRWLTSFLTPPAPAMLVIGRVTSIDGQIKRVHGGDMQKLAAPFDLHDGDRLETDESSKARLRLNSQDELEIEPKSSVSIQRWSLADPQAAVYLTILNGDVNLLRPGVRGRAYVVRGGRLFFPGQHAENKPPSLTVSRGDARDLRLSGSDETPAATTEFEADTVQPATGEAGKSDVGLVGEPETLSNEYIDQVIVSRQPQLQKCWLSRLKAKPNLKGQISLQFEITRRGKVHDVKVADHTVDDRELQKCVMTVIERIAFRGFKGPEISLTYPVTFE